MTRIRTFLSATVAVAGLSACMGAPAGGIGPSPLTPTQRFTLQVEPGLDRIALAVHEDGLSSNQQNALVDIANRFSLSGAPLLVIEGPGGGDTVASDQVWKTKAVLEGAGVPGRLIQVSGYNAPDARAPVLVGFETIRAVVPQCGASWTNLARTGSNESSANFGCAVTANLAAQIANPRDIVQPRDLAPADGGRRSVVFDNYRKGVRTGAPQEELVANQRVSQAVQ